MGVLTGQLTPIQTITGNLAQMDAPLVGTLSLPDTVQRPYHGEYDITPSDEEQVLDTKGKILFDDITVAAIPSNYGKITWDGHSIRVS